MEKMRDSIDFSSEDIPALYRKVLYPTLLGMLAAVSYTIADGVFVGQAAQPIISYNYALRRTDKTRLALNVSMKTALIYGVVIVLVSLLGAEWVVRMFLKSSDPAYPLAVSGLRLFSAGFIPFAVNVIAMSYFQSIERARSATLITVLRSFVLMGAAFLALPPLLGIKGAWLAVPTSEILTMLVVLLIFRKSPTVKQ